MSNLTSFFKDTENRYWVIALIAGGIIIGGWYGYSWYKKRGEYQAQKDFAESISDYYKMLGSGATPEAWQDIEKGLAKYADKHKGSVLAPYFLAYQADSLLYAGKTQEAISTLDKAIKSMKTDIPVYYMYATKKALIKLDSDQDSVRKEGILELSELSQDKKNPAQDMALYYLGYNAMRKGNNVEAEKMWSQLIKCAGEKSVWAQRAKAKLQDGL